MGLSSRAHILNFDESVVYFLVVKVRSLVFQLNVSHETAASPAVPPDKDGSYYQ